MTLNPCGFRDGHRQAMAGRFTPSILRRRIMLSAISAPVLPQLTAACASPVFTASMHDHMDVPLPCRTTCDGLAFIVTTWSVWRSSTRSANTRLRSTSCSSADRSPCKMNRSCGFSVAAFAMPETTEAGPRSPPIASMDRTVPGISVLVSAVPSIMPRFTYPWASPGSRRVVVEINLVGLGDDLTVVVRAAGRADMMRAFQLSAGGALVGVCAGQRIMGAAHTALGARYSVLWDSHVSTSVYWGAPVRPPDTSKIASRQSPDNPLRAWAGMRRVT